MSAPALQLLCFRLGERYFAVDIGCIRELLRSHAVTAVPGAPAHLAGVLNLRGELVTVYNLHRVLLGQDAAEETEDSRLVVVRARGQKAALRVDQVVDVMLVDADELTPVSGTPPGEAAVVAAFRRPLEPGEDQVVLLVRLPPFFADHAPSAPGGVP
ncbi:MAG: chemotaxis protein CheW [Thermodesulfobacteriota bacterium]